MSTQRRYNAAMDVLDAQFVAGATALGQLPAPTFAEVAFAGRSNVGKSSLINNLVNRKKLVRTSSAPGCTRAINIFRVRLRTEGGEAHLDLVDLPGYGYTKVPDALSRPRGPMIERYLCSRASLRGLILLMDARHPLTALDRHMLEWSSEARLRVHVLLTKSDKLSRNKARQTLHQVQTELQRRSVPVSLQLFSSTDLTGSGQVRNLLLAWLTQHKKTPRSQGEDVPGL